MKKNFTDSILNLLRKSGSKGMSAHELSGHLRVRGQFREDFFISLNQAVKHGTVVQKKGRYFLQREKLVSAKIISVKEGFGFAGSEEMEKDVFIPGRALLGAMPGDLVELRLSRGRGDLPEGEVIRITEECNAPFAGVLHKEHGHCEILPDSGAKFPIQVSPINTLGAHDGDKVLGRLVVRGESHYAHKAEVTQVFGRADSAAACSEAILAASGIEKEFTEEVLRFAAHISEKGLEDRELKDRLDLRGEHIFTMDGADTKDIDDAVSLEKDGDEWHLGVHIADVSHYVKPHTPLDDEAYERGTSVYYANSVIPMLPPALSNGICSLNPGEDRLAFSALLTLDAAGVLKNYRFVKTIVRSRVKGVYAEINAILEKNASDAVLQKYDGLLPGIYAMQELAGVLSRRRMSRGGLNLESSESKIKVDEAGRAVEIVARQSGASENMIEEFMLTANEAAASFAMERSLPFLYRIHENPTPQKIETLCALLDVLGVDCSELKTQVSCASMAKILQRTEGTELQLLVNNQILRSMAKAKYSEENKGHFGLVLKNYAHFTSPIRRYPDLSIHRIMTSVLSGMPAEKLQQKYTTFAKASALQSSNREVRAMTVERDCEDCYKAEYMARHLGESFDGVISGVTARGIYVELANTVEGMVRLEALPEGNYEYDGSVELLEKNSGACYRVGMPLRVLVAKADVSAGNVDFVPAPQPQK